MDSRRPSSPTHSHQRQLPESNLFAVQHTLTAGRGIFASQPLPDGTLLHTAARPSAYVTFRPYRREVCAWCFAYDRGRAWKLRDAEVGFVYCTNECRDMSRNHVGVQGRMAWESVEKLVKTALRKGDQEVPPDQTSKLPVGKPTEADIKQAWLEIERTSIPLISARLAKLPTKAHLRLIRAALDPKPDTLVDPDVLSFLLSGIHTYTHDGAAYASLVTLASHSEPYSSHIELHTHTAAYIHLLAVLPVSYLPNVTPARLYEIATRDSHNAFGIRSPDDDGSEFLGFGVWGGTPSLFNHACAPNVRKCREGAHWVFEAARDVDEGEELCISYLGEEVREMGRSARREALLKNWGFNCLCQRCLMEEQNHSTSGITS